MEKNACDLTETLPLPLENVAATKNMGCPDCSIADLCGDTYPTNDSTIDSDDADVCILPSDEEGALLMRNQLDPIASVFELSLRGIKVFENFKKWDTHLCVFWNANFGSLIT